MEDVMVSSAFVGRSRDGARFPIEVNIGRPYRAPSGLAWTCPVEILPLLPQLKGVEGADPLQATCLACVAALQVLRQFTEMGGAVLHEDGSPCPLDAYLTAPSKGGSG